MMNRNCRLSLTSRFTVRFSRALIRIIKRHRTSLRSTSPTEIAEQYIRVKMAADASMASSVGSKRAWSRAMLSKFRGRSRHHFRVKSIGNSRRERDLEILQAEELRELVPGGEDMDICRLLEETAHYIKCLTTQVKVMKSMAGFYSN